VNEKIVPTSEVPTNVADFSIPEVITEVRGQVGFITLNRPKALNALSLPMIRSLSACLLAWRTDDAVKAVAFRGMGKGDVAKGQASATGPTPFGAFCAGGDIRFFHQAALAGNPELEDFFTEEYRLNHLIHSYPKPTVIFMDGIVMGGGMGLCGHGRATSGPGATLRLVTERTKMAMPETAIGLFPDVGGGYFLSRCPGHTGEWLALTGDTIGADEAVALGLADACVASSAMPLIWEALGSATIETPDSVKNLIAPYLIAANEASTLATSQIDQFFALNSVSDIVQALERSGDAWARQTAATLRQRSPLMLHVALEQIRRARHMNLADELRMERDMVHNCFNPSHLSRSAADSETVEGIRALAIDKDHQPLWSPAHIEDVTLGMVAPFFDTPWAAGAHPLQDLG
jgi:enoyl-CoA hydratase/carnithine racemase